MMSKGPRYFIYVLLLILLLSCSLFRFQSSDPFYVSTGTWDSSRFPLLKPYEMIRGPEPFGWSINFQPILEEPELYGSVSRVQKVAVIDGVILVYTPERPPFPPEMLDDMTAYYWYVMIPKSRIQRGFETEKAFLAYMSELQLDEITWSNPNDLFDRFSQTGCLDWIPGCQ